MKTRFIVFSLTLIPYITLANIPTPPNFTKYEKQKRLGAKLYDFNDVNEEFNLDFDTNNKVSFKNTVTFGVLSYSLGYNQDHNQGLSNTIGISKNLKDFFLSKKYLSINEYYENKERVLEEYNNILDIYSNLIIKKHELESLSEMINKLNSDRKIFKTEYSVGKISKIDYESLLVDLLTFQEKIESTKDEANDLLDQLHEYGYNESIENIEDFDIKEVDNEKIEKYVREQNEKHHIQEELAKQYRIHKLLPDMNLYSTYTFESKNFGIGFKVNKSFKVDGSDITEAKMGYVKKAKVLTSNDILKKYNALMRYNRVLEQKLSLQEKIYKINKVKYSVGNISYKDLTDSKIKENDARIELLKNKNNIALFFLKKGM